MPTPQNPGGDDDNNQDNNQQGPDNFQDFFNRFFGGQVPGGPAVMMATTARCRSRWAPVSSSIPRATSSPTTT